ncbi:2-oxoglutarate dehydrogenase E1 component [Jeotgalibacillus proteolyticus]|uniref:2-oxoglutarate dehydrogenase E1 component n=1 Tax=Jeotgalibacillus proteolyticus TaxID=2082395 RepID=A0A2S5GFU0_9BACL|nr:2-oxoglutarate dehydrogenase E1 component [Jeotgalibacillus proteolyticus]PPA71828.1 2-oxoglutarate dehydrogenase E1 component [Jeotgalibacillus proteolyticus]
MRKQSEQQDLSSLSFSGPNLGYMIEMYDLYQEDPSQVDEELQAYFKKHGSPVSQSTKAEASAEVKIEGTDYSKVIAAVQLADAIRAYGHLAADINPLNDREKDSNRIELETYGLTQEDLEKIPENVLIANSVDEVTNGFEAIEYLKKMYTKSIAFEYAHVHDKKEKEWLKHYIEAGTLDESIDTEKKKSLLKRLIQVEGFENFVHKTFVGQKRFSIEGLDTMVPLLDEIIQAAVEKGAESINIGMAHRGRLNVLAHVLEKPYEMIFAEFQHSPSKDLIPSEGSIGITYGWTGDVKYHLGADRKVKKEDSAKTRITLANNPSHLEVVSPIVAGYTRAAQEDRTKAGYPSLTAESSLAIMIHGDAAFPGQGIVAETLNMSQLRGYHTGGSIHLIANNMIGFTTESFDSRSTKYASDTAKGFEVPIIHVNADDPEACLAAAMMAYEYRSKFGKDFVIDLIGYRRFGHNEMDEPMVTNPKMYTLITKHDNVRKLYQDQLVGEGLLSEEEADELKQSNLKSLQKAYDSVPKSDKDPDTVMDPPDKVVDPLVDITTSVELDRLKKMNEDLLKWTDFNVFKKLEKILKRREDPFTKEGKIDWAHAETLAFGAILQDGVPIRLSGQDSQRGTFAHRHLVLHDEKTGKELTPLHQIEGANASFVVYNSPLTEAAVVGFEYGYNVFSPETLVLWEAQYGDFANMAQVMFDQFVSSSRAKWGQKSGLVMLLPHGYEGQGPEHSSARMERFLTLAAENNWTVANLTSSSQYFHILRRQASILEREEVRPLVIMTPKSLLRHPLVSRTVNEFTEGSFKPLIEHEEYGQQHDKVERLVFSTGKVGIDLIERASKEENNDWLHIIRIEEIYPFPMDNVKEIVARYPNLKEIKWIQEEPKNMGAWTFVEPRLKVLAPEDVNVEYIGRRRRSSPAEGDPTVHKKEQTRILTSAVTKQ